MSQKTIRGHVSTLRNLLKLHTDDSNYTDQFLYKLLSDSRALLIRRRADKFHALAPYNWQSFCMPLEEKTYHDCSCVSVGCQVLKGTIAVPHVLMSRNKPQIKVTDLAGRTIPYTDEKDLPNNKYSKVKKDKPTWTLIGDDFYLFNTLERKMVVIRGIFEDPFEIAQITTCVSSGSENTVCYDINTEEFPLDADMNMAMYQLSADQLGISFQIEQDMSNDAKSNT